LAICRGIGEGLNFLYKLKVVHRDIKLHNIFIDDNGCPIIYDFGMARYLDKNGNLILSDLDHPGGHYPHLAPEILNSFKKQKEEGKKEIEINYSKQPSFEFGVICYEILCGNVNPFGDYPERFDYPIEVHFNRSIMDSIKVIPAEIIDKISLLLKNDPNERHLIEEILPNFG